MPPRLVIPLIALVLVASCSDSSADTTASLPRAESAVTTSTVTTDHVSTTTEIPHVGDLLVMGDWGSGTTSQGAVADAMHRYAEVNEVTAILTTGDNFYSDDAESLMEPYLWAEEAAIPFWVTWGNHDVESETRIEVINETFGDPPRWAVFEWGGVDVVVLDSNQITSPEQAAFFLSAMAASVEPAIVVMHHPPYSCSHHGSTTELVNQVVGALDEDVFLVLSGHDHNYQRFDHDGVSYVVTGGGGNAIYPIEECPANHPEPLAGAELHHFLAIDQDDEQVIVTAIDVSGDTIDQMSLDLD